MPVRLRLNLGPPDVIHTVPEPFAVEADGRDEFRVFVLPTRLSEGKWVKAVEFKPGNPRVVHHILAAFDVTGQATKKDEADPGRRDHDRLVFRPRFDRKAGARRSRLPAKADDALPPEFGHSRGRPALRSDRHVERSLRCPYHGRCTAHALDRQRLPADCHQA